MKKMKKKSDKVNDNQPVDRVLPPPGIPVKSKKNRKNISIWNQRWTRGCRNKSRTKMG